MRRLRLHPLFASLLAALLVAAVAAAAPPPDLDELVARVRETFEVPGIALAIVHDGEVELAKGYGVRRHGGPDPVSADTRFSIASNTKAFTATALALLVEERKLEWDAPVVRYLPWFQMWDPWVTRQLTVRDLLVHRSGLGPYAGDLLWWGSTYDRREIIRRLRFIEPATSFRSAYAYDNVLYLVAGLVVEEVSGMSWEDFVRERILDRVGMGATTVRFSQFGEGPAYATPHAAVDGTVRPVAADPMSDGSTDLDSTNPAGGMASSAADMAKWLQVQLARGRLADGSRLFAEHTAHELWTLVTPMPIREPPPDRAAQRMSFNGYALGFQVHDYRGRKLVTHTGGMPGFVSKLTMVPELGLGIVVLTNQESGAAFMALTYAILDHYLEASDADWVDAYAKAEARRERAIAAGDEATAATRGADSSPSLPLADYATTYRDAWYGDVTIALDAERLVMRFGATPKLTGDLEHWQHDTFVVRWRDPEIRADAFVTFALDPNGRVEQAKMRAVSSRTDPSYDFHDLLLVPVPATP